MDRSDKTFSLSRTKELYYLSSSRGKESPFRGDIATPKTGFGLENLNAHFTLLSSTFKVAQGYDKFIVLLISTTVRGAPTTESNLYRE